MFSNELEQANSLITRLKGFNAKASDYEQKLSTLKRKLDDSNEAHAIEKANYENRLLEAHAQNESQEKRIDSMTLELKNQQQLINQEKMLRMQEEKQEDKDLHRLRSENDDLKLKLDEKQAEIKQLCDQMKDLNSSVNNLKSNDASFLAELQQKTEQFLFEIDAANKEISALKAHNEKFIDKEKQAENNARQLQSLLEEKTREASQLKTEAQKNVQHISAQAKAIEKLQEDLRSLESAGRLFI